MVNTQILGLKDSLWALILPMVPNGFFVLILRGFFLNQLPDAVIDSARVDGAGEFRTFFQIVLPLSVPAMGTIGLFGALRYWNDWFLGLLYIDSPEKTPLQYLLMRLQNNLEFLVNNAANVGMGINEIMASLPPHQYAHGDGAHGHGTDRLCLRVFSTLLPPRSGPRLHQGMRRSGSTFRKTIMKEDRKMRIRRSLLIVLALMTAGGPLFAAGGQEEADEDMYEIVWYHIGNPTPQQDEVFQRVNEYVGEQLGVQVRRILIGWGDYQQRMQTTIAAGEPFDMLFTASWLNYNQWASNGGLMPIDDLMERHGQDLLEILPTEFIDGNRIDGNLYGVAANKELAHQWAVVFNMEYVEKYDLELPEIITLDALEEMLTVIEANEPGITPLTLRKDVHFMPWLEQYFDGSVDLTVVYRNDQDYRVVDPWATPEMRRFLTRMRSWYEAGYMPPDVSTINDNLDTVRSGRWFAGVTSTTPYADLRQSRQWGLEVRHVPFQTPIIATRDVGGSMMAISATSEQPEAVMAFINLMNTDPYLRNLIEFGIEGVHWEFVDAEAGVHHHRRHDRLRPLRRLDVGQSVHHLHLPRRARRQVGTVRGVQQLRLHLTHPRVSV